MNEEENKESLPSTKNSPNQIPQLNNPTTDKPIVAATETSDIINPTSDIKEMEVHHHSHEIHGKKNWKSYFWEFLMLFLAVFCGFLAEYQLEHKIEKDREKEFMKTMISDLKEDTVALSQLIKDYKQKGIELDSLVYLLKTTNNKEQAADLYYYGRKANRVVFFNSIDRTIQQMKNSGGFRLIKNERAANSILRYYSQMDRVYLLQGNFNNQSIEYRINAMPLFDPLVFETMLNDNSHDEIIKPAGSPVLLSYEKASLLKLISILHYMKGSRRVLQNNFETIKDTAEKLIELLKQEYHLE